MGEQNVGNRVSPHAQQRDCNRRTNTLLFAMLAVVVASGSTLGVGTSRSEDAPELPPMPFSSSELSTFQNGKITAVRGDTVQIDNRDYELRPDVIIRNPEGVLMETRDFRKGALARFHLKQGRIDKLLVILPD